MLRKMRQQLLCPYDNLLLIDGYNPDKPLVLAFKASCFHQNGDWTLLKINPNMSLKMLCNICDLKDL